MSEPAVSIILPTYNGLPYLRDAIESVRAQTFTNWELIVIDDGSTDDSVAWLRQVNDPRIQVLSERHSGRIGQLRNLGIHRSVAPWVAFIDSDDRWAPTKLERQLAYHAANPQRRWSYSACKVIDAAGNEVFDSRMKPWIPVQGRIVRELLRMDAMIALPGLILERPLLEEVGGFDEELELAADYDLELRLAGHAQCGVIAERLIDVRSHPSTTMNHPGVPASFITIYRRFRRQTHDPVEQAICLDREAVEATRLGHLRINRGEWSAALRAVAISLRARPMNRPALRAAARIFARAAAVAIGLRRTAG